MYFINKKQFLRKSLKFANLGLALSARIRNFARGHWLVVFGWCRNIHLIYIFLVRKINQRLSRKMTVNVLAWDGRIFDDKDLNQRPRCACPRAGGLVHELSFTGNSSNLSRERHRGKWDSLAGKVNARCLGERNPGSDSGCGGPSDFISELFI